MKSLLQFHLSYNNGAQRLWLPVNPSVIRVESAYKWNELSISKLGDYSIPAGHALTQISLSSFFPRHYNPSYCEHEDIPDPWETVALIGKWKESRQPIRIVVTGAGSKGMINHAMTIRNFSFEERGGEPGDVYYTLDLKEHRFITVNKIGLITSQTAPGGVTAKTPSAKPRTNYRIPPKTYVVVAGDNLSKICARLRVQGVKDVTPDKLYQANKKTIGKDRNVIKIGQKLIIP